jgi:hypothetical protein
MRRVVFSLTLATRKHQRRYRLTTLGRRCRCRFSSVAVSLSSWSSAGVSRGGEEAARVAYGCPRAVCCP